MAYATSTQCFPVWIEVDLDATAGDKFTWTLPHGLLIHKVVFVYTEATPGTIASPGVVAFDYKPATGNRTELATYTAETSKAVGYTGTLKKPNGKELLLLTAAPGDTIYFEHKNAQTNGVAGKGIFVMWCEVIPDGIV